MKIICIHNGGIMEGEVKRPEVGTQYTVVDKIELMYGGRVIDYYILAEMGPDNCYAEILFAHTGGPDERERLEEWHKEYADKLDRNRIAITERIYKLPI